MPDESPVAWPPAFAVLAGRVRKAAESAERNGRGISARDHFLRASMFRDRDRLATISYDTTGTEVPAQSHKSHATVA